MQTTADRAAVLWNYHILKLYLKKRKNTLCLSGMQEVLYSNHVFAVGRLVNYNIILPYFYKALKTW